MASTRPCSPTRGSPPLLEALAERSPFPVVLAGIPNERFSPDVEVTAYRVVADAARCGAVAVTAHRGVGELVIDVDARAVPDTIVDLRDRVGALDGRLDVEPHAEFDRLHMVIPCRMTPCASS